MEDLHNKKNKHLTLPERIKIEAGLNENYSIRKIAREINRPPSTIVYEISNRKIYKEPNHFNGKIKSPDCDKLVKASSVCNGCNSKIGCRKRKYYYRANDSQSNYKDILISSREGIDMDCEEFMLLNNTIKEDIEKGHSFYMIVQNNPQINITERTLYNYQESGYFITKNIDLPRKVRYKKRKRYVGKTKKDRIIRIGRTYNDFQEYIANNSITHFVELDTVEGIKGKDCLLTMAFIPENFLLTFKMKKQNSVEVSRVFTEIKSIIGYENFYKYFNVILTDNGPEFTNVLDIENNGAIIKDSKVFFCDPYRSDQKAGLEVTHSYIRRYIETGQDFTKYTNNQILDMTNNINSANREKHDGKTPYEKIIERIDSKILERLGYKKINSKDVILNGRLFK